MDSVDFQCETQHKTQDKIGVGIADVTDYRIGLPMQGMADPSQKINGVEFPLYSRSFVLSDERNQQRVAIAVVDIWACTATVKAEVIKRLQIKFHTLYTEENTLISGTHTHSGPGGFSDSRLYEHVTGGFNRRTFECIVAGVVESIEKAHFSLQLGKVYVCQDRLPDCGRQRSKEAYLNNPCSERIQYAADVDDEMLLLKFVAVNDTGEEIPIGLLNWQAIHPTDRGQRTTLVNGDNKGFAAQLTEKHFAKKYKNERRGTDITSEHPFVAAFANANCGDVSGNVEFGHAPNGKDDEAHMQLHGRKLFSKAIALFDCAAVELRRPLGYRHTHVDMANVAIAGEPGKRTWPAAIGLAFVAGSKEDSVAKIAIAGFTIPAPPVAEGCVAGQLSLREKLLQKIIQAGLRLTFGAPSFSSSLTEQSFTAGHWPKPVILAAGLADPPLVPSILPLQIIQLGELAITAVPGELSTMAGRRLKKTMLSELKDVGVRYIALATYANDYSLYITTEEEYEKQHYEGAVTLYGPHTLAAYQQAYSKLARALKRSPS